MDNLLITELDEQRIDELLIYTPNYSDKNAENIKRLFLQKTLQKTSQKTLQKTSQKTLQKTTIKSKSRKNILLAAVTAAILITLSGISIATYHFLKPSAEVIHGFGFSGLSEVFNGEDALEINASQTAGGYIITLMSIATGSDIPDDKLNAVGGGLFDESTFVLIEIKKEDGSPMQEPIYYDETVSEEDRLIKPDLFYVSPFVKGYKPSDVNSQRLIPFGGSMILDGIKYILIECSSLTAFANHGVYIGVTSGDVPNFEAFILNEETGEITSNPGFEGVNILFELPLDISLADPKKAQAILNES